MLRRSPGERLSILRLVLCVTTQYHRLDINPECWVTMKQSSNQVGDIPTLANLALGAADSRTHAKRHNSPHYTPDYQHQSPTSPSPCNFFISTNTSQFLNYHPRLTERNQNTKKNQKKASQLINLPLHHQRKYSTKESKMCFKSTCSKCGTSPSFLPNTPQTLTPKRQDLLAWLR